MRNTILKRLLKVLYFRPNSVHRICFGPLRGMFFKVSDVTGLSPWYSGSERCHQRTFKKLLKKGDVILDIGANWGIHSLYFSRLVGSEGKVIAIEPYPLAFAELKWHLAKNRCLNTHILQFAMSDSDGQGWFLPAANAAEGRLAFPSIDELPLTAIPITTRTVDSIVDSLGLKKLVLFKVDVEGHEVRVLTGAEKATNRFRPYIVIDLHTPAADQAVAEWLIKHHYRLERLFGPPIFRTDVGWPSINGVWGSILAIPLPLSTT